MNETKDKFVDVYEYIKDQELNFRTTYIPIGSNWKWNMYKHIDKSFLLKNSQYSKGDNEEMGRPFKNIILPIANVNYRTEGFDVKDIELYVNDPDNYPLSLLVRKYHDKWAIDNSIDTVIDDSVVSYFDYGLTLVKNVNDSKPEVIDLKSDLAFCNQSDVLAGAICLKHDYSIDELQEMKGKWDSQEVDRLILATSFSTKDAEGREIKSPRKSATVYELHGVFPESWLGRDKLGDNWEDKGKYTRQMHIISYYKLSSTNEECGITLFKSKIKQIFKALKRDKISKRACGRGGIEELFHPQTWTCYSEIQLQGMLEATSKVITKTTDKKLYQQNKNGFKNNQVVFVEDGKTWEQMVIQPFNKTAFDNYSNSWEQNARVIGSASDPALGLNPTSGTPLGTTTLITNQGQGIHEYRRGQLATFWGEIYRDWILEHLKNDINKGKQWADELTLDELSNVVDKLVINATNKKIYDLILKGNVPTKEERDSLSNLFREKFMKSGTNRFLKIAKEEFKEIPLEIKFNIAGKQEYLSQVTEKLNNIFRTVFANPAALQQPGISELFNKILESSGLNPIDFSSFTTPVKASTSPPISPIMSSPNVQSPNQLQTNNQTQ